MSDGKSAGAARGAGGAVAPALGLYVALALALCGPALLGRGGVGPEQIFDGDPLYGAGPEDHTTIHNDATPVVVDLPRELAFARGLHHGRIDAWNPHAGCGAPLWAEQGGPFFPLKLPLYLAPSLWSLTLFLLLRLCAAGLGTFLLARRRGLSTGAATIAGALFELSGALFAHLAFSAASAVFVLPFALLGAQAIADADGAPARTRAAVGTALAVGCVGHAGHPTLIALVLCAFGLAVLGHALCAGSARRAGAILGFAALGAALGLALAAPALLPLAELASVGRSYKDTDAGERVWAGDLARFRHALPIALFAPHLLRPLSTPLATLFPYLFAPTLGVLGLTLGLAGALGGALAPSLLLPLVLGVALATAPPGLGWVHQLPVLRLIMPQYPWSLVALPLALGAGAALDGLATRRGRTALALAALAVIAGATSLRLVEDDPAHELAFRRLLLAAVVGRGGPLLYYLPLVLAPSLAIAATLPSLGLQAARGVAGGLGALAIAELLLVTVPAAHQPRSEALRRPPSAAVEFLADRLREAPARLMARPYTLAHPNTPGMFGLDDLRAVTALPVRRFVDYLGTIGPPVAFTVQTVHTVRSYLYDQAAVRWMVVRRTLREPEPLLAHDPGWVLRWHDATVAIYENLDALPRFRVIHDVRPVADAQGAARYIGGLERSGGALGHDPPTAVEVDDLDALVARGGPPGPTEQVRLAAGDDPDALVLDAHLDRDGMVLCADTFYPGWSATVDGQPAVIHAADLMFRAVPVPAGDHRVVLRYRPASLRRGGLLFALAALAAALLWRRAGPRGSRR